MIKLAAMRIRSLIKKRFIFRNNANDEGDYSEDVLDTLDSAKITLPSRTGQQLALVAGWFSYEYACATFGDTEAMNVVSSWLEEAGILFDIACHPINGTDGLDLNTLDPTPYSMFIFVCGPWRADSHEILKKFSHCYKIGIDLSLEAPVHREHGFDVVIARDMPGQYNLVFAAPVPTLPLVGIAQVHPQVMYGDRQRHEQVESAILDYLSRGEVAPVILDTLYCDNPVKIGSAVEYENLVGRLDVVITTRLHGLVFALKKGVPVVAIDAIAGGAKVTAQAETIGWPLILNGDTVDADEISRAVKRCLSGDMDSAVVQAKATAMKKLQQVKSKFLSVLSEHESSAFPENHKCNMNN